MSKRPNQAISDTIPSTLRRYLTLAVPHQKKDDCLIYAIANVFMRQIVILLGWTRDKDGHPINWDETNPDNCQHYKSIENEIKYQYCILYTYIQGILRKSFGSCGANAEPVIKAFCKKMNEIIYSIISPNNVPTNIIDDDQIITLIAQNQQYISDFETIKAKRQLTLDENIQLDECMNVKKELEFELTFEYKSKLVTILQNIKIALNNKFFNALKIVIYDKDENLPLHQRHDFIQMMQAFYKGFYGVMHFELSPKLFTDFERLRIKHHANNDIIYEITKKVEQQYQIQQKILSISAADQDQELERLNIINSELSELLKIYLELPSGLNEWDTETQNLKQLSIGEAFEYIQDEVENDDTSIPESGHAVVVKNFFLDDFYTIKNQWNNQWGLNGELIIKGKEVFHHTDIIIIYPTDVRNLTLGGKQSHKTRRKTKHKKTYRKLQRKLKITTKLKRRKRTKGYKRK
jgi:hypothetical protein